MNEHGLAVGMAAEESAVATRRPGRAVVGSVRIMRLVLERARTVPQAVAVLGAYDLDFYGGPPLHYFVADATGASAIVEFVGGRFTVIPRGDQPWQVMVNFQQATSTAASRQADQRWRTATARLAAARGRLDPRQVLGLLGRRPAGAHPVVGGVRPGRPAGVPRRRPGLPHGPAVPGRLTPVGTGGPVLIQVGGLGFEVAVGGPAGGPAVLLLHGFPENSRMWDGVVPFLHGAGLRTVAPDQRGYSPGARPAEVTGYAIGEIVGDALGLLDALDLPAAHVLGHDWGAVVGWHLAAKHPDRVRTFTAVSVPHPAVARPRRCGPTPSSSGCPRTSRPSGSRRWPRRRCSRTTPAGCAGCSGRCRTRRPTSSSGRCRSRAR